MINASDRATCFLSVFRVVNGWKSLFKIFFSSAEITRCIAGNDLARCTYLSMEFRPSKICSSRESEKNGRIASLLTFNHLIGDAVSSFMPPTCARFCCCSKTSFSLESRDLQKWEYFPASCEVVISSCRPLMWWLSHIIKLSEVFHASLSHSLELNYAAARHIQPQQPRFIIFERRKLGSLTLTLSIITIAMIPISSLLFFSRFEL